MHAKRSVHRSVITSAAAAVLVTFSAASAASAQIQAKWVAPVSGNWSDGPKWGRTVPPDTRFATVIDAVGAPYTVTVDQSVQVGSLHLDSPDATTLLLAGTSFTAANGLRIDRGTFLGGAYIYSTTITGTGRIDATSATRFAEVSLGVPVHVRRTTPTNGHLEVSQTITLANVNIALDGGATLLSRGASTIQGSGEIIFDAGDAPYASRLTADHAINLGYVTIGPDIKVRATTGDFIVGGIAPSTWPPPAIDLQVTNNGLLSIESPGRTMSFEGRTINNGTILASNGATLDVNFNGKFTNNGVLEIASGSTLRLGGNVTDLPETRYRRDGGNVIIYGTYTGTGRLDAFHGGFSLAPGAAVRDTTITPAGGIDALPILGGVTFRDVTLDADATVPAGAPVDVVGRLTVNRLLTLGGGSHVKVEPKPGQPTGLLDGSGTVVFNGGSTSIYSGTADLAIGPNLTLRTGTGSALISDLTIVNHATISAETPGQTIAIDASNHLHGGAGTYRAVNGGTLAISSGYGAILGPVTVATGGKLSLSFEPGATTKSVESLANDPTGRVELDGDLTAKTVENAGRLFIHAGSTLTVEGPLDNSGWIDLNGSLVLKGTRETRDALLRQTEAQVAAARNAESGRWQGKGITSALAKADPLTGISVIPVGDDVLATYTYNGDIDADGRVTSDDYFAIDAGFLAPPADPTYAQGDFNSDDRINSDDYFLIDSAFLGQGAPLSGTGNRSPLSATAVPQPALLPVLLPTLLLLRRRRNAA